MATTWDARLGRGWPYCTQPTNGTVAVTIDLGASCPPFERWYNRGSVLAWLRWAARIKAYNEENPAKVWKISVTTPYNDWQTGNCRPIGSTLDDWHDHPITGERMKGLPSIHSIWSATDVKPRTNPFDPPPYGPHDMPLAWVAMAKLEGITWGGDWSYTKDWMHFEATRYLGSWDGRYPDYKQFLTGEEDPMAEYEPILKDIIERLDRIEKGASATATALVEQVYRSSGAAPPLPGKFDPLRDDFPKGALDKVADAHLGKPV